MKIAIVSFYLMESTIPLAKHLSLKGIRVDLFSLLPYLNQNTFVYDFSANRQPLGFVKESIARKTFGKKLCDYLSNINTRVFIFPDRKIQKFFGKDLYFAFRLAKQLRNEKYDLIHIIHTSPRFWRYLFLFLDKKKVVQTLHEVTSHEGIHSKEEERNLKLLIKEETPIIFHSRASKQRFIDFRNRFAQNKLNEDQVTLIRFGLFETYYCFSNHLQSRKKNEMIHILNFGRIVPSKGINILVEAVRILQNKYSIHLTIAGSGNAYFDFNGIKSYDFINRSLSNEEIVHLIEDCDLVVLPYTSASQSGIPMTVYAFNKPIVASNIAGLKEVIQDGQTGVLVNDINPCSFATAIETLLINNDLRKDLSKNINEKYSSGEFSWPFIADQTIEFYSREIRERKEYVN